MRFLVLLAGGVLAACVQDLVLCAGDDVLNLALCLFVLCLCLAFAGCSTLGTEGVENVGNWVFGCVVDLICRVLLMLVYSGTLELAGLHVVVVGVVAVDFFGVLRAL